VIERTVVAEDEAAARWDARIGDFAREVERDLSADDALAEGLQCWRAV